MVGIEGFTAGLMTLQRFYALPPSLPNEAQAPESADKLQKRKVVAGFLAATLPQVNGGHEPGQQPADVVAWTTSRTINPDVDSLSAAFIRYLEQLLVLFVNEGIPMLKEATGLLNLIHLLSKYLDRSGGQGADLCRSSSMTSNESTDAASSSHLNQVIFWLGKACRDQPVDDPTLTKAMLTLLLQMEPESTTPQANAELAAMNNNSVENETANPSSTLGFKRVTASSAVAQFPQAAIRLRLTADLLHTYGINLSSQHNLHDIQPDQDMDEDTERLLRLREEIGLEPVFAVVTARTASVATDVLLQQVDRSLEALEWALTKLRHCGLVQPSKLDYDFFSLRWWQGNVVRLVWWYLWREETLVQEATDLEA